MRRSLTQCPVCDSALAITEFQCGECGTTLSGEFPPPSCAFCSLAEEQRAFLELFLKCRGNLRDVERQMGLSYPTVRSRLDVLLTQLGYGPEAASPAPDDLERRAVLERLESGDLAAEDAIRLLEAM